MLSNFNDKSAAVIVYLYSVVELRQFLAVELDIDDRANNLYYCAFVSAH